MFATKSKPAVVASKPDAVSLDVVREFHRRMAAIIEAVQTGIWQAGVHDLLGYSTDYAFGQQRGVQTLVLKSKHRSHYVRVLWDTVMMNGSVESQAVDTAIRDAISGLS